jgi:hypothetical protein
MPRPKLNPSQEERLMVKIMAGMAAKHEHIAARIGIRSPKTLRKYFREELDFGASEANLVVAQSLHKKAREGDVTAGIFWMKSRAGWRDGSSFERASGPPAPFIVSLDKEAA